MTLPRTMRRSWSERLLRRITRHPAPDVFADGGASYPPLLDLSDSDDSDDMPPPLPVVRHVTTDGRVIPLTFAEASGSRADVASLVALATELDRAFKDEPKHE